jgi:hypothetical protein
MPQKVYYAERKYGRSTSAGDEIRARHRELVEALTHLGIFGNFAQMEGGSSAKRRGGERDGASRRTVGMTL